MTNITIFNLADLEKKRGNKNERKKGHTDVYGVRFQKPLIKTYSERYDILRAIGKT